MAALTSALTPVIGALGTINTLVSQVDSLAGAVSRDSGAREKSRALRAQQDQALAQLQARQSLSESQERTRVNTQKTDLQIQSESAARTRRDALRRAVSRQKSLFGASGTGSGDGSAQAVLLGLFEESDQESATRERLDTLRARVLDQGLADQKTINVLQRTQLRERQGLERLLSDF